MNATETNENTAPRGGKVQTMTTETITGSRHAETANLSLTEVAKLVREDIKTAKRAGLPVGKVSVRVRHGNSIDVEIKTLSPVCGSLCSIDAGLAAIDGREIYARDEHTAIRHQIHDTLTDILRAYNRVTTYYFCQPSRRFFGSVQFDVDLTEAHRDAAIEAARALRAYEAEFEAGEAWVSAYYHAEWKTESAGYASADAASFADMVRRTEDPAERARLLALAEENLSRAEELLAEAATARATWAARNDEPETSTRELTDEQVEQLSSEVNAPAPEATEPELTDEEIERLWNMTDEQLVAEESDAPEVEPEGRDAEQVAALTSAVERALRELLLDAARAKLDGDEGAILDAEEFARSALGSALAAAREVVEAEFARRAADRPVYAAPTGEIPGMLPPIGLLVPFPRSTH